MKKTLLTKTLTITLLALNLGCAQYVSDWFSKYKNTQALKGIYYAGFSKKEFNSGKGMKMAGYGARKGFSEGVHDKIYSRAVVVSNQNDLVAIVSTDLLVITEDLKKEVLKDLKQKKIPLEEILLTATHTHSSIGAYWNNWLAEKAVMGKYDDKVFTDIAKTIADSIEDAFNNTTKVSIGTEEIKLPDFVKNRRDDNGKIAETFGVISFKSSGKTNNIVIYTPHPTVLNKKNLQISGDFAGALEKIMEEDGSICLYLSEALGDQKTNYEKPHKDRFEKCNKIGEELRDKTKELISRINYSSEGYLGSKTSEVKLPPFNFVIIPDILLPFEVLSCLTIGKFFVAEKTQLQLVEINDTVLAGIPADCGVNASELIKKKMTQKHKFTISQSNDYIGYVLAPNDYKLIGYEELLGFYGKDIAEFLAKEYSILNKLMPSRMPK